MKTFLLDMSELLSFYQILSCNTMFTTCEYIDEQWIREMLIC